MTPTVRQVWRDVVRHTDDPGIDVYARAVAFALDANMTADGRTRTGQRELMVLAGIHGQHTVIDRIGRLVDAGYLSRACRTDACSCRGQKPGHRVAYQALIPPSESDPSHASLGGDEVTRPTRHSTNGSDAPHASVGGKSDAPGAKSDAPGEKSDAPGASGPVGTRRVPKACSDERTHTPPAEGGGREQGRDGRPARGWDAHKLIEATFVKLARFTREVWRAHGPLDDAEVELVSDILDRGAVEAEKLTDDETTALCDLDDPVAGPLVVAFENLMIELGALTAYSEPIRSISDPVRYTVRDRCVDVDAWLDARASGDDPEVPPFLRRGLARMWQVADAIEQAVSNYR